MTQNTTDADGEGEKETRPETNRTVVNETDDPVQNHALNKSAKQLGDNPKPSRFRAMGMVQALASVVTVLALFFCWMATVR